MYAFNHACTHVICVKRVLVWKGLTHYFLTLIGACKRIRRGKVRDRARGERENAIWGESQVGLLNEWILMQIHANLCAQGSGSARGCFDWQLQVCVCWGGMLGSGCFSKVGHGCLSMFYMLWIYRLHTSVAYPLHRASPSNQQGSHPQNSPHTKSSAQPAPIPPWLEAARASL